MEKNLLKLLTQRIDNKECPLCGKKLTAEKISINHNELGDMEVCLSHMGDKIE